MASEWGLLRLGDICTKIGSGATPRGGSEVYLDSGPFALIRSQNIYNEGFHSGGLAYIGEEHAAELQNVEVREDDVLLNITGDSVARVCQVDSSVLPARVNQHVAIVRPDPKKLDPRFLRYFLVSPEMQVRMLSWAGSGGTRNALTKAMIEQFEVLAPLDTSEQRAIANILGTLDDKIELNRRMNETLEAVARALFRSWFVDFDPVRAKAEGRDTDLPPHIADLFPDAFEETELGEIPRGWRVGAVGGEFAITMGQSATSVKVVYRLDSVIGHATSCATNACSSFAVSFEIRPSWRDVQRGRQWASLLPRSCRLRTPFPEPARLLHCAHPLRKCWRHTGQCSRACRGHQHGDRALRSRARSRGSAPQRRRHCLHIPMHA